MRHPLSRFRVIPVLSGLLLTSPAWANGESVPSVPDDWAEAMPSEVDRAQFVLGDGLEVVSDDGHFALTTRLRAQFRYTLSDEEDAGLQHLFLIRRARLLFTGHMFGEHNTFKTELAFSPRDEGVGPEGPTLTPLLDWYGQFTHIRDLTLRVGQYKVPFSRQRVISSGDLQMVDRTLAQGEFHLDRDVGAHLTSKDLGGLDLFRYYAGAWMNQGRDAHEFSPFQMMYIGRVEVLPFGIFDDYSEVDFQRRDQPGLSVGGAYAFLDDASGDLGIRGDAPTDGGTTDMHVVTADALFKYAGFSAFTEVFYRRGERNPGQAVDALGVFLPVEAPRDGMGWTAQAGYLLPGPEALELSGRYSEIVPVEGSSLTDNHELGGAISWYEAEHSLKLQADYFRLWSEGLDEDGWNRLRVQLQLAY